jgi:TfoX/Sxy family transcriptional regulator of competence genes
MDKIAETTRAKFERHGIATLLDMKMISTATISAIKEDKDFWVSKQALKKWAAAAEKAHEGSAPSRVRMDHR